MFAPNCLARASHARAGMPRATLVVMSRRAAIAALCGCLVACIDDPVFVPLVDDGDGGVTRPEGDVDAGPDSAGQGTDSGRPDGPRGSCAEKCGSAGGTCDGDTCVVTCSASSPCKGARKCPPGLSCRFVCEGKQACDKVDCVSQAACAVQCTGEHACNGDVRVDAPSGEIVCDGPQACNGKVECRGASCAVSCGMIGCKLGEVRCCADQCTVNGIASGCKRD